MTNELCYQQRRVVSFQRTTHIDTWRISQTLAVLVHCCLWLSQSVQHTMTHVHLGTVHWTSTRYRPQHCRTRVSPHGDENWRVLNNVLPSPKHHHLDFL